MTANVSAYVNDSWGDLTWTYTTTQEERARVVFNHLGIISQIICFVGLAANVLSVTAVCHIPFEKNSHFYLIVSLAVSDILVLLSGIICDYLYIFMDSECLSNNLMTFLMATAQFALLANLLVMSLDHYLAIIHPMKYQRLVSNFRCICLVTGLWVLSILFGLSDIFVSLFNKFHVCHKEFDNYQVWQPLMGIFALVLIIIVTVYLRICFVVCHLNIREQVTTTNQSHNSKAVITTILILVTFVLGWLPYEISNIYQYVILNHHKELLFDEKFVEKSHFLHRIALVCIQANSVVDPLIYGFRLKTVRLGYRLMFNKIIRRSNSVLNESRFRQDHTYFVSSRRHTTPTIISDQGSIRDREASVQLIETITPTCEYVDNAKSPQWIEAKQANEQCMFLETDSDESKYKSKSQSPGFDLNSESHCIPRAQESTNKCWNNKEGSLTTDFDTESESNLTETVGLSPLSGEFE